MAAGVVLDYSFVRDASTVEHRPCTSLERIALFVVTYLWPISNGGYGLLCGSAQTNSRGEGYRQCRRGDRKIMFGPAAAIADPKYELACFVQQ